MRLNGLPNKPKHNASNTVDLPEPFSPIMSVDADLSKEISIGVLPVDKKFCHDIDLNTIINMFLHKLIRC